MIELNLLPKNLCLEQKKSKKTAFNIRLPKINIPPMHIIISVIGIIFISQAILGIIGLTQKKRKVALSAELALIASQEKVATTLKEEVDVLLRKLSIIDSLTQGSLLWSEKLYDVSMALIDGVWLRSLSLGTEALQVPRAVYNAPGQATPAVQMPRQFLVLKGSAVSSSSGDETAIVGKFIDSLKNNESFFEDFDDIKLSSIQRKKKGEIELMEFTLVCYFKQGRSYFEKLAAGN